MSDRPETAAEARPDDIEAARRSVAREAKIARRRLAMERAAQALWPLWAVVAAFLGLALIGVPQSLPYLGHILFLLASAAAVVWAARWAWLSWRAPSAAEALDRLDGDAARDRPVLALGDALAAGAADPSTQSVWAAHQRRMAARALLARAPDLDLRVSHSDRFALRHAAALALAVGLAAQMSDGGSRLAEALTPVGGASAAVAPQAQPSLEAWATPPIHTGVAPLYLTDRAGEPEPIALPTGSEIVLRVFDVASRPTLTNEIGPVRTSPTAAGDSPADAEPTGSAEGDAAAVDAVSTEVAGFADLGDGAWTATVVLERDGALAIAAPGADFAGWRFAAIPDAAPSIAFTEPPTGTRAGALRFAFETSDDYGVARAVAVVTLDESAEGPRGVAPDTVFEPIEFELPLPLRGAAEDAAETVVEDLHEHPWAGLPVIVQLVAEDGAGQTARVETATTLPGRRFIEPLAKSIIEQRRELAWSVETADRVERVLEAVTAYPDDVFEDATAYLAVRTAIRRLGYARADGRVAEETPGVAELLWEAALRIEDGDLSDAERRLRQLQEELSEAIENGASDDEIAQLMDELREAMRDYLQQLAQEALRNQAEGQQQPQQPIDPNQMLSQQDLERMLDQLEQAMRDGMQDMARQMLEQLQQMLENLQMAEPGQQGQQGQGEGALSELQDMIGEQQGLADRSFDALRRGQEGQGQQGQQGQGQQPGQGQPGQGQPGGQGEGQAQQGQGSPDLGAIARDQEGLRGLLEDLREGLGQSGSGEALDRADEAMRGARESLEEGDADGALQDQVDALDALREGAQELAQEMQNQPGQSQQAGRDGRSGDVRDEDPFGRPTATDGPLDGDTVTVPDASARKRARELMDEIRRRAEDLTRPSEELDYLRRLLERF